MPDAEMLPSEWAEQRRIVPDYSANAGPWRNSFAPFLVKPMDCMAPAHPCESVTIKKSGQSGGSEIITNVLGAIIDVMPGPTMVVHPTVDAAKDWVAEKLDPTIDATKGLKRKVAEQRSRDNKGSTAKRKRFPGGMIIITGANSTRALRQRSIRFLVKDDWSDWPLDVDGQGDPDKMADARQISYTASGLAKRLQVSTPTIKGICRVTRDFEAGDQQRWHVPCPQCGHPQVLRFFPDADGKGGLRFEPEAPHKAVYVCEQNGCIIPHSQKREMVAKGDWIAALPDQGRQPSFEWNALISPVTTWGHIAKAFLDAKDQPTLLKTFFNLWLGEAWEERGEAPDWQELEKRAEEYELGHVPTGALILTLGSDVQANGIYWELVAWGRGLESWSIGFGFIEGETADPNARCWQEFAALGERRFPDAHGRRWPIDMVAIDANYLTEQVCSIVAKHPNMMAIRGVDGWDRVVLGVPSKQGVTYKGAKVKRRATQIWPVYGWNLKGELYAWLRKKPPEPGAETYAPGYCHFSTGHSGAYYQQLTSEALIETKHKGRIRLEWRPTGPNHWHDCRIYARAALHRIMQRLGLAHGDPIAWARLAAERGSPPPAQGDLLEGEAGKPVTAPLAAAQPEPEPEPEAAKPETPPPPTDMRSLAAPRRRGRRSIPNPNL